MGKIHQLRAEFEELKSRLLSGNNEIHDDINSDNLVKLDNRIASLEESATRIKKDLDGLKKGVKKLEKLV